MDKAIKYLSLVGKAAGLLGSLQVIPGISPQTSVIVFFVASVIKDLVNRIGDYLDDGKENGSFKP